MKLRAVVALMSCLGLLFMTTSCSYHRAHISYDDRADKMPLRSEPWDGQALGMVAANEAGAIWNDCTKSAEGTLWVLMDETKKLGGNAIGDIRWIPNKEEKGILEAPTCKKAWGWILLWPALATPVFMSSRAQGQAYKISESAKTEAGLYRIPASTVERAELIDRILTESAAAAH